MNEDKMSSNEVPQKFADWLLAMGCPAVKVPPLDKVAQMCRGHYYMVWRSLMEHVEPKDVIRQKRLQVFHDDVQRCKKANSHDKVVVPAELTAWREHQDLTEKVAAAETRVRQKQDKLEMAMDKVSSKLAQRNLTRQSAADIARRLWLLQSAAAELTTHRDNLQQTRAIADELCRGCDGEEDVEAKLDKCLSQLMRQSPSPPAANASLSLSVNPAACSSVVSSASDDAEEQLSALASVPARALWRGVCARRAAAAEALAAANAQPGDHGAHDKPGPQSVLAATRALYLTLCLETMKHRVLLTETQERLEQAIAGGNNLTDEACELLVVRCERARAEARQGALRRAAEELRAGGGVFSGAAGAGAAGGGSAKQLRVVDRAIAVKKQEIQSIISSLQKTERKIQSIRESLTKVFRSFQADQNDGDKYRGNLQLDLPHEAMASLRQFYSGRAAGRAGNELSLNLDSSEMSDVVESSEPTLVEELRIYLKKFNLEKNRKLVLENGSKIWIFETLHSAALRFHSSCMSDDASCALVCPSEPVSGAVRRLARAAGRAGLPEESRGEGGPACAVDITSNKEEEEKQMDKIKKRLNENIQSLQKTKKTLEVGQENLKLWSENQLRKYVSTNRTVDGKGYRDYEALYLDSLNPTG